MDVLRSIAIIGVICAHITTLFKDPFGHGAFGLGAHGVKLFFVLSGWLLGSQLFQEQLSTGKISIVRFWLRRWLRTLPAYYFVLGGVYLWQIGTRSNPIVDLRYLVFIQNYDFEQLPYFPASWSLCVEEHFYLAIAPLLQVFRTPRTRWILLVVLAFPTLARSMGWFGSIAETHVRFDVCGFGVLLAYIRFVQPAFWVRLARCAPVYLAIVCAGVAAAMANRWGGLGIPWVEATEFWIAICTLVVLAAASVNISYGVLDSIAKYIATRAYSLYLLHQFAIVLVIKVIGTDRPLALFAAIWILSLVASEFLYRFLEKPVMNLRDRFSITRIERAP